MERSFRTEDPFAQKCYHFCGNLPLKTIPGLLLWQLLFCFLQTIWRHKLPLTSFSSTIHTPILPLGRWVFAMAFRASGSYHCWGACWSLSPTNGLEAWLWTSSPTVCLSVPREGLSRLFPGTQNKRRKERTGQGKQCILQSTFYLGEQGWSLGSYPMMS